MPVEKGLSLHAKFVFLFFKGFHVLPLFSPFLPRVLCRTRY
jgi:hypothetical protein